MGTSYVEKYLPSEKYHLEHKLKDKILRIADTEIGIGVVAIILSIGALILSSQSNGLQREIPHQNENDYGMIFAQAFHALWSGLALSISGFIAYICSKRNASKKMAVAQITTTFVAAITTFMTLILSLLALSLVTSHEFPLLAIHAILAILGILGVTSTAVHVGILRSLMLVDSYTGPAIVF